MTVYLERGGKLIEMTKRRYDAEDVLQSLIARYPDLLAGEVDPSDRSRLVLIAREVPVADSADAAGRWSLDHLFVDQDGVPTLVEVKRSSDTRVRREVSDSCLSTRRTGRGTGRPAACALTSSPAAVGTATNLTRCFGALEWTRFRGQVRACAVRSRKDGVRRAPNPTCVSRAVPSRGDRAVASGPHAARAV